MRSGFATLAARTLRLGNGLLEQGIEINRCQHNSRESTFHTNGIDILARVGEQDIWRGSGQDATQVVALYASDKEDAGLLNFNQKGP